MDDRLKQIFDDFNPQLGSDTEFMRRMERQIHTIEVIKEETAALRRKSRRAIAVAALTGFVVGMLSSLTLPWLGEMAAAVEAPAKTITRFFADNYLVVACLAIATASILTSINAYEISMAVQSRD